MPVAASGGPQAWLFRGQSPRSRTPFSPFPLTALRKLDHQPLLLRHHPQVQAVAITGCDFGHYWRPGCQENSKAGLGVENRHLSGEHRGRFTWYELIAKCSLVSGGGGSYRLLK